MRISPPGKDPAHLNGAALTAAGRSHAMALYTMSQTHVVHVVIDLSDYVQVVAVATSASCQEAFTLDIAERGARLLFLFGDDLRQLLVDGGLLATVEADQQTIWVTSLGRVHDHFNVISYVIVSKSETAFPGSCGGPLCTCKWFARYGGYEHIEYSCMLDLRLQRRSDDYNPQSIPTTRRKGRKKGVALKSHRDPLRSVPAAEPTIPNDTAFAPEMADTCSASAGTTPD